MNAFARVDDRIGWQVWVVLAVQLVFYGLVNIGYGCIFILVTNASPSRSCLGAVNGCAQTAASLMRAIGPASTTALFAVSVEKNLMGGKLVFVILLALVAVGVGLSLFQDDGPMKEESYQEGA